MPTNDRRAAARRRAWGRGPKILRFEPLEERQLLSTFGAGTEGDSTADITSAAPVGPDLISIDFQTDSTVDWGTPLQAQGTIKNQGNATAREAFQIDVYVSSAPKIGDGPSIKLGSVAVPEGLKAGESFAFEEDWTMPTLPLPGVGGDNAVYVSMVVDGLNQVAETDEMNNLWQGRGIDSSLVLITPQKDAALVGRSFQIDRTSATWGDEIEVHARIENVLSGQAPITEARVVLVPSDKAPGGEHDVTIGRLEVPEFTGHSTREISGKVKLPDAPPPGFPNDSTFLVALIPDADKQVNPMLTPVILQGRGLDWDVLALTIDPKAPPETNPTLPDLAPSEVLAPGTPLVWGQDFQVAVNIRNLGQANAGSLRVRFLLAGPNGETTNALVLGDTTIPGIATGETRSLIRMLRLPGRLPFGMTPGDGLGRIVVQVDPDNDIAEANETNNTSASGQVTLRLVVPDDPSPPAPRPNPTPPRPPGNPTTPSPTPPRQTPTPPPLTGREAFQQRMQERRERLQAMREELLKQRPGPRFPAQGPQPRFPGSAPTPRNPALRVFPQRPRV